MLPSLSVSRLLSDLAADGTSIAFDMPDGGYDRLHRFLESHNALPKGGRNRFALTALMLVASRVARQTLGEQLGPISDYFAEVGQDGIREEAKRILETAHATQAAAPATPEAAFWVITPDERAALMGLYGSLDESGRARLRSALTLMTARQLAVVAGLTPDHLALMLDLLSPRRTPTRSAASVAGDAIRSVNEFLFPWMRTRREVSS